MNPTSAILRRLLLLSVLLIGGATPAQAGEPQIAFSLKKGWIRFSLTKEEKAIPDAQVTVYDEAGNKFAEGETDAQGQGEFPVPAGALFRVEVKTEGRTADLIQLTKSEGELFPNRVLLSFGLAPCCKVPSRTTTEKTAGPSTDSSIGAIPLWVQAVGSVGFTLLGLVILLSSRQFSSRGAA